MVCSWLNGVKLAFSVFELPQKVQISGQGLTGPALRPGTCISHILPPGGHAESAVIPDRGLTPPPTPPLWRARLPTIGWSHGAGVQDRQLATGGSDGDLCFWDLERPQQPLHSAEAHVGIVNCIDGAGCKVRQQTHAPCHADCRVDKIPIPKCTAGNISEQYQEQGNVGSEFISAFELFTRFQAC